jgi:Lrp/AsnC family leucine-responsive transcriptional regulator
MLPVQLDDIDIAVLKSLAEDGRKSFRAISREISVSTPTVKSRYLRLVNYGLIKSVRPVLDLSKVDKRARPDLGDSLHLLKQEKKHFHIYVEGLKVKLKCDFCGGPVHDKPKDGSFAAQSAGLPTRASTVQESRCSKNITETPKPLEIDLPLCHRIQTLQL